MIVNSAYMYMGKKEPVVKLNLFENGVSNYPTEFQGGVTLTADGLKIPGSPGIATFLEIPFSKFKTLTLTGHGAVYTPSRAYITIQKPNGETVYTSNSYSFKASSQGDSVYTIALAELVRVDGYKLSIRGDGSATATLTSAVFELA